MGEVFRAWDTVLDREVALKILEDAQPAAILRFMKEAQLQARVDHPHVCRIFDVEVAEGVPCIAMQLVAGPNLRDAAPDLGPREAAAILEAVADAMHAAHRLNLVHRDLKPSNILLERGPLGAWVPFVADFGLAKDLDEDLTRAGAVVGTPVFMAPEQRAGDAARVGPPADIFALGATLCAVLEVERPMPGTRSGGRLLPWPGKPPLPRDLERILLRCLEERPSDRYPDAAALAADLRRFLRGEPLATDRFAWFRRTRSLARRHPAWAASLGMALALGAAFAVWSSVEAGAARRRTRLAIRFAGEARELEAAMAVERLLPPHDLAPLLDEMTEGLARIRTEMERLGPEALGPGNLALGRGYLAMRFLAQAQEAFQRAWAQGERTPDAAYALAKVHCEYYIRITDEERMGDIPPGSGRAGAHLAEARRYRALAAGAAWEPVELCDAMLRIFEGDGEGALALARRMQEADPAFHPAWVEESYAWQCIAYRLQRAGDAAGAEARYARAEAAALHARASGRSDITCWLASLDWRLRRLEDPALEPRRALALWDEAEALADGALALRPRYPGAISAKVHVLLGRARTLKALGRDWAAELDRAGAFLRTARPVDDYAWLLPVKRAQVARTRSRLAS